MLENGKAIGQALQGFETTLLSKDTTVWSIRADRTKGTFKKENVDQHKLAVLLTENTASSSNYELFFINRFLIKNESDPKPDDAHKLRLSAESLRLLTSRYFVSPSFMFALPRFYLPNGQAFHRFEDERDGFVRHQWYFLPFRVQVPCTDKKRSHATSTTGSNQMNPFHYLHLPDEEVDIRGSQIAVYFAHKVRSDSATVISFNFMDGRWPGIIEEPQIRMAEALKHSKLTSDPILVHLIYLTTIARWWNNALHSVNEQLIAYEKRLQEDAKDESTSNAIYNETSKALHAMAAHVHRYGTELGSLEDISSELSQAFAPEYDAKDSSATDFEQVKSQLKATGAFVRELEKKTKNILALLFNRMQITNDRMMVANGVAMHAILKATQEEAAFSREIAIRSQQLSEDMKKDSVSMKTIAILTMFFLPATSFAALLAMPFFATNKYLTNDQQVWVWVVLTVPSTGIAYAFYHFWRKREVDKPAEKRRDLEMNHVGNASDPAAGSSSG
ncbi:MAG: hypothetical protein Q9227_000415 [Pyrenula ochraceoflavens]